jgi:hypothetical protein
MERYRRAFDAAPGPLEVAAALVRLYREDVAGGHVAAVQEIVAGASSVPGLREEVLRQMEPWFAYAEEVLVRLLRETPFEGILPARDLAFAAVALYVGVETLTHLEGDRTRADALFALAEQMAALAARLLQT